MYLLLIFLSIIGVCLAGLFGRYLNSKGFSIITTSCVFVLFFLAIFAFYNIGIASCFVYENLFLWVSSRV